MYFILSVINAKACIRTEESDSLQKKIRQYCMRYFADITALFQTCAIFRCR